MHRELGTGIVFLPGLESLVESFSDVIDVLEVEPQTLWYKKSPEDDLFCSNQQTNEWLLEQKKPILFHSVSLPVGGSLPLDKNELESLINHKKILNPVYCSEHLSFNRRRNDVKTQNLNFLLPPLQSVESIRHAVTNINLLKKKLFCPLAIETGTNYFQPMKGELDDGFFIAEIARKSDCNILLDIQNLLTNEKNGRQKVMDFFNMLPKEKIVEIHLSGGYEDGGIFIDAHSHPSSDELWGLAREMVCSLPNLNAIIFEMIPEYLHLTIFENDIKNQFGKMKDIWEVRGSKPDSQKGRYYFPYGNASECTSAEWENIIGDVLEEENESPLPEALSGMQKDKGIVLLREMIFQIRISSVSSALTMSSQYILAGCGSGFFESLVKKFIKIHNVEMYGFANGLKFAEFLKSENIHLPYMNEIIDFEIASLHAIMSGKNRKYTLPFPPGIFLEAIMNQKVPEFDQESGQMFEFDLLPSDSDHVKSNISQFEMEYHS
jgi:uncharacterized protein